MHRHYRRLLAAAGAAVAVTVAAPLAFAAPQNGAAGGEGDQAVAAASEAELAATRPAFKMPFLCGQQWLGSNWNGHSPAHSIDWNHYDSNGNPDDRGRRVFASAGGTVLESHYSTTTGYGNTVVIGHGNGWQTRYAHLKTRGVQKGDKVKVGARIGQVGATSAKYTLSPHLHYEQIHNGRTVVAVVQGVTWHDFTKRNQTSKNRCG